MKLFKKLASIHSASGCEDGITRYILKWVKSSISDAKVSCRTDSHGNIYITKGESETYPCVVAHLDQVQDKYPKDYRVHETSDIIFAYSMSRRSHCGLGADDKCGIWIALKMLRKHPAIKVAFFPGEEVGCHGSSKADMSFFSDVRFVIEPDRRGSSDIITSIGGTALCSEDFLESTRYQEFGFSPACGLMTDVEQLKNRGLAVSCINISCGYYSPHSDREYVVKRDMLNTLSFIDSVITECTATYPHKHEPEPEPIKLTGSYTGGWSLDTLDERDDQLQDAYNELISLPLVELPMTGTEFLLSYGDRYPLLTAEDGNELIDCVLTDLYDNERYII